jgi:8-oxo-dGTP diphosphatase
MRGGELAMAEQQFYVGVHGVIANRGRVLILRRASVMTYQPHAWDLPGGHLGLGESFEECLLREVREETALEVTIERLLGLHAMPGEPYLQALYACRPAIYRTLRLRPDEHSEARWVAPDELASMEGLIPYLRKIVECGMLDYLKSGAWPLRERASRRPRQ